MEKNQDNTFDIIYSHFVFHDILDKELEKIILTLNKLLKNNGKIFIREPLEDIKKIKFIKDCFEKYGFRIEHKNRIKIPLMGDSIDLVYIKCSE